MQALEVPVAHFDVDADTEGCLNSRGTILNLFALKKQFQSYLAWYRSKMETNRKKAKLFVQPKIFSKYYYALIDSVISVYILKHIL